MTMACLVLASGLSRRFGDADKLMADLNGRVLLAHTLDTARQVEFGGYFIVTPDPDPRAELGRRRGFSIIANLSPEAGQGASLALGARYLLASGFNQACILLGDMPFISPEYLRELIMRSTDFDIIFSHIDDRDQPPAVFSKNALDVLTTLTGDKGARSADLSSFSIGHQDLPANMAPSYDTQKDFKIQSN